MGMDKGGFTSDFIIDDKNSYANLAQLFHELYILELFLNKIKKIELNKMYWWLSFFAQWPETTDITTFITAAIAYANMILMSIRTTTGVWELVGGFRGSVGGSDGQLEEWAPARGVLGAAKEVR